jgi:YD repeat-containing protein
MQQRQLTRDDVTMTWQVSSFDGYGRPASVTRSSSQGASRTDTTSYYNDTTLWILGQVASQTNNNSGLVEAQTTYNTAALPTEQRRFGKLVQTLTYHADGSVASVADGRGNATGLSNWKRGTPQLISFADGTSMSASVDDNGWIRSTTNEVGYQSTFDYDPMGRLVRKTFATGDSVAWNPTTQVFERVDAVEHGLAAGHWRLTTNTGNRSKVTWFDAMWRPALILEQDGGSVASTARYQRFSYDHAGRTTFQSYPAAGSNPTAGQWSEFDALGRPTSTSVDSEQGLLTTITAYLSGMRVRTTDPRGQSTTVQHRVYDSPMYDMPVAIEHPGGAFTDIARDVFGKPTSIKRRNATSGVSVTRSYVYNPQQELCKSVEPETGATAMGYDAAGNLAWSAAGLTQMAPNTCDAAAAQASGRRVDRTYDARNRLKQLFFADGSGDQIWSYNNVGSLRRL